MMLQVCVVRDRKSELFGRPFFVQAIGMAMRSFEDEVNREEAGNVMNQHAADFSLFHIGTYEESVGLVKSFDNPVVLAEGVQVLRKGLKAVSKV